eukprot:COSAG01_NODE_5377_length_4298_cov_2.455347_8_plen_49_part_00
MAHDLRAFFGGIDERGGGGAAGEPFARVDWVAVPRALRARRASSSYVG